VIFYDFLFFQAEDGIRDFHVTGVQTCALPIYTVRRLAIPMLAFVPASAARLLDQLAVPVDQRTLSAALNANSLLTNTDLPVPQRSEERRVGKDVSTTTASAQVRENERT